MFNLQFNEGMPKKADASGKMKWRILLDYRKKNVNNHLEIYITKSY